MMSQATITSDNALLEMLRVRGSLGVSEISESLEVTPTAVRQRLARMMANGLIDREAVRAGRGRPKHRYLLTQKGLRLTGSNFADLAIALWREIRSIEDRELRRTLLTRVVKALAEGYAHQLRGRRPPNEWNRSLGFSGNGRCPLRFTSGTICRC